MRFTKSWFVLASFLFCVSLHAQPARRIAIISGNGPLERSIPGYAAGENRMVGALTGKLVGKPGITLIAQSDIDTLLKTQNFENSDRSSTETAARIGRLLGAAQIMLANYTNGSQSSHQEISGGTTKVIASVEAEGNVRLIDVETGAILAQPSSSFKQDEVATEIKKSPATTTGEGLPATLNDLWAKATEAIAQDLSDKLMAALAQAPAAPLGEVLVAGVVNGSVFINKGRAAGIKNGEQLQIVRMVSTGVTDPATNEMIKQKQRVCVFTVTDAEDGNSSGTCAGGTPQRNDMAEPLQP